jgi:hypothetical protein
MSDGDEMKQMEKNRFLYVNKSHVIEGSDVS